MSDCAAVSNIGILGPLRGGVAFCDSMSCLWGTCRRLTWVIHLCSLANFVLDTALGNRWCWMPWPAMLLTHGDWQRACQLVRLRILPAHCDNSGLLKEKASWFDDTAFLLILMGVVALELSATAGDWPYWLRQGRALLDASLSGALEGWPWGSLLPLPKGWAGALAPSSRPAQLFCRYL